VELILPAAAGERFGVPREESAWIDHVVPREPLGRARRQRMNAVAVLTQKRGPIHHSLRGGIFHRTAYDLLRFLRRIEHLTRPSLRHDHVVLDYGHVVALRRREGTHPQRGYCRSRWRFEQSDPRIAPAHRAAELNSAPVYDQHFQLAVAPLRPERVQAALKIGHPVHGGHHHRQPDAAHGVASVDCRVTAPRR
jgi:hypothetical protein